MLVPLYKIKRTEHFNSYGPKEKKDSLVGGGENGIQSMVRFVSERDNDGNVGLTNW